MTMRAVIIFVFGLLRIGATLHTPFRTGTDIHCDQTSPCKHQHIMSGTECNIECSTYGSCRDADLQFSKHCDYSHLNCSAYHACLASNIACAVDGYCEINTGVKSIKRSTIQCASNGVCIVHCNDLESCAEADIYCADGSKCFVECHTDNSCIDLTIYAQNAQSLHIMCNDESCNNLRAYCPTNISSLDQNCLFDFHGAGAGNEGIEIYAIHRLSRDFHIVNHDQNDQQITLFCDDKYSSSCPLSPITGECTDAHAFHICNYNRRTNEVISVGYRSTPNNATMNVTDAVYRENKHALQPYIDTIRRDKVLLWVTLICLITCTLICCYMCCDGFHSVCKPKETVNAKISNDHNIFFVSSTDGEGCNVEYRSDDFEYEYDSSISISI